MATATESSVGATAKRAPICAVLSAITPFVSVALAFGGQKLARNLPADRFRAFEIFLSYIALPLLVGLFCGLILAGASAWRDEKWPALRWVGYILNGGILTFLLIGAW